LLGGAELIRPDPNLRERLIRRTVGSLYAVGSALRDIKTSISRELKLPKFRKEFLAP